MAEPNLNWNRRAAVPVGALGVALCLYGLIKWTWLGLAFSALGVALIVLGLFHRRLKWFRLRAGPTRVEAEGEFVADLGGEGTTEPPKPSDATRRDRPQP